MSTIHVPKPQTTEHAKEQMAIEGGAFHGLITVAKAVGIELNPVMGLMELPEQKLTRDFIEACRAIIAALRVTLPNPQQPETRSEAQS